MAISTYPITLNRDTSATETPSWAKLCDIKDFPDLGSSPEAIDATTLSDAMEVFIQGIKKSGQLEFTANYDDSVYDTLAALTGSEDFQLWFGTDGISGKFSWTGTLSAYLVGAGVNAVVEMKVVITPSTAIVKS